MKKFFFTLIVICIVLIVLHAIDLILIKYTDLIHVKMFEPYGSIISIILLIVMIILLNKHYRKE